VGKDVGGAAVSMVLVCVWYISVVEECVCVRD
jgi:hypothetical protein